MTRFTTGLALLLLVVSWGATAASSPEPSPSAGPSSSALPSSSPGASPSAVPEPPHWTLLEPAGDHPAPREDHTFTVDPEARAAYLFGGRDAKGAVVDDLWRLDLATDTWTRLTPVDRAPHGRFGHAAVWVPGTGLVIWAGEGERTFFDDLWAFEPATSDWRKLSGEGQGARPKARYGSCAGLGPDGRLWISHGFTEDSGRFDDAWAFDFLTGRWTDETTDGPLPRIRCLHDCTWTPDGRFLLYGGQTTGVAALGDLWARTVDGGWVRAARPTLPERHLYGLAVSGGFGYVFGGADLERAELGDLWQLDLATLSWQEIVVDGERPSARSGAAFVADDVGGRLLLFGGRAGDGVFGDLWVWSPVATPVLDQEGEELS